MNWNFKKKTRYKHPGGVVERWEHYYDRSPRRTNQRFKVIDTRTGQEMDAAFTLFPEYDAAARAALVTYAETTRNKKVAQCVRSILRRMRNQQAQQRQDDRKFTVGERKQ